MPRIVKPMGAAQVAKISRPGFHAVGGVAGLQLQVTSTGARSWVLRYSIAGRRRKMGLGSFGDVSLAQARAAAREARALARGGVCPIEARNDALRAAERVPSFDECAARHIKLRQHEWSSDKHAQQWANTLATYASPYIGSAPVDAITKADILDVLRQDSDGKPLWHAKTETASRLRQRIESVLSWATSKGMREGENPARWRGNLDADLPRPTRIAKVEHQRAVSLDDAAHVMGLIRGRRGVTAQALQFLILTAARVGEVVGATWAEIDLKKKRWTIPAERMKARRVHEVPLSAAAVAVLLRVGVDAPGRPIFANQKGEPLSLDAMRMQMRRLKLDAVPHGWRSTFRDWAAELTTYPHEMAEMALAHRIDSKTEAAYRRGNMAARRAGMAEAWALYLDMPPKQWRDLLDFTGWDMPALLDLIEGARNES